MQRCQGVGVGLEYLQKGRVPVQGIFFQDAEHMALLAIVDRVEAGMALLAPATR